MAGCVCHSTKAYASGENRGLIRLRGVGDVLAAEAFPVPGVQLVDASDRMIGNAGEDVGGPGLGIDVVELGGHNQAVEERRALAATIGAGEQPSLATERQAAQRPLRCVVGEADAAILQEAGEGPPSFEYVVDGAGDIAVADRQAHTCAVGEIPRSDQLIAGDPRLIAGIVAGPGILGQPIARGPTKPPA